MKISTFLFGCLVGSHLFALSKANTFSNPEGIDVTTGQPGRIWAYPPSQAFWNALALCRQEGYNSPGSFVEYDDGCEGQAGKEYLHATGFNHFSFKPAHSNAGEEESGCFPLLTSVTCSNDAPPDCQTYQTPETYSFTGTALEGPRRVWAFEAEGDIHGPRTDDFADDNALAFCKENGYDYFDTYDVACDGQPKTGQYHTWSQVNDVWQVIIGGMGEAENPCIALFTEIVCCHEELPTVFPPEYELSLAPQPTLVFPPTPQPSPVPTPQPATPPPTPAPTSPLPGNFEYAFNCSGLPLGFAANGDILYQNGAIAGSYTYVGNSLYGTVNGDAFSTSGLIVHDNILVGFDATTPQGTSPCRAVSLDFWTFNLAYYNAICPDQRSPLNNDESNGISLGTSGDVKMRSRNLVSGNPTDVEGVFIWYNNNVLRMYFAPLQHDVHQVVEGTLDSSGNLHMNDYTPTGPCTLDTTLPGNIPASNLPQSSSPPPP